MNNLQPKTETKWYDDTKFLIKLAFIILSISTILSFAPHSKEYIGWRNTEIACNWCTNGSGCSCSGYAGWCVEEYRKLHNLTFDEFPTYVIANDEYPPIW